VGVGEEATPGGGLGCRVGTWVAPGPVGTWVAPGLVEATANGEGSATTVSATGDWVRRTAGVGRGEITGGDTASVVTGAARVGVGGSGRIGSVAVGWGVAVGPVGLGVGLRKARSPADQSPLRPRNTNTAPAASSAHARRIDRRRDGFEFTPSASATAGRQRRLRSGPTPARATGRTGSSGSHPRPLQWVLLAPRSSEAMERAGQGRWYPPGAPWAWRSRWGRVQAL
jgi:hypothetical protein